MLACLFKAWWSVHNIRSNPTWSFNEWCHWPVRRESARIGQRTHKRLQELLSKWRGVHLFRWWSDLIGLRKTLRWYVLWLWTRSLPECSDLTQSTISSTHVSRWSLASLDDFMFVESWTTSYRYVSESNTTRTFCWWTSAKFWTLVEFASLLQSISKYHVYRNLI